MTFLNDAYEQLQHFQGSSLRTRIADLESALQGIDKHTFSTFVATHNIHSSQLVAALLLKHAASQINEIVHALGILLSLPHILHDGEVVEYVSLASGNTGRPFDLETSLRIAEFKFTDWKGGPEAIRQNQLFKDFYLLAEADTLKVRYLYLVGTSAPLKFFHSRRTLSSVMSRSNKLWTTFQQQYGTRFATVNDYYQSQADQVQLVDLATLVPLFQQVPKQTKGSEA